MSGIGLGVYFGLIRATALQGERRAVIGMIQSARSAAAAGSGTFIRVDTAGGRLHLFGRTKVGVWHFEVLDDTGSPGAFGHVAVVSGGDAELAAGKIGKALSFDGSYHVKCKMNRAGQWIEIPTYDARDGVAVEAWVMPRDAGAEAMAVVSRDGWFDLWLEYDETEKRFALAATATTLDAADAGYRGWSATTAPVIRPNEWTHVSMTCHKLSGGIALRINGIEQDLEDSGSSAAPAPSSNEETAIGAGADGGDAFHGLIDEVNISLYAANIVHRITSKLKLEAEGLAAGSTIRFDSSGKLDAVHNGTTPKLILKDYKGDEVTASVVISIGAMGALDVTTWHK